MTEPLLSGTNIILRRQQGAWQLFMGYPPGAKLPANGSPLSFHLKDLSAAYAHVLDFHSDENITGGSSAAVDPSSKERRHVNDGDIFRIQLTSSGWEVLRDHAGGGFSGQFAKSHRSIGAALESIRLLSEVD